MPSKSSTGSSNGSKDSIDGEAVRSMHSLRAQSASLALGMMFCARAIEMIRSRALKESVTNGLNVLSGDAKAVWRLIEAAKGRS